MAATFSMETHPTAVEHGGDIAVGSGEACQQQVGESCRGRVRTSRHMGRAAMMLASIESFTLTLHSDSTRSTAAGSRA